METASSRVNAPDAQRGVRERQVITRHEFRQSGIDFVFASESIKGGTDWTFSEPHHSFVVHRAGAMTSMECVFDQSATSHILPAIGDLWIIPAGRRYAALATGGSVSFAEIRVPTRFLGDRDLAPVVAGRDPLLHQLVERISCLIDRSDDVAMMLRASLGQTLRLHLADRFGAGITRSCAAACMLTLRQRAAIEDFVDANLGMSISIDDIARHAGIAKRNFVDAFRRSVGLTPWAFVLGRRLQQALLRVRETSDEMTIIALELGFSTPSHFSTAFKRRFGVSPSAARSMSR